VCTRYHKSSSRFDLTKAETKPTTAEKTEKKKKSSKSAKFSDEQFLAALKQINHPASRREVSDALGIKDPD